MLFAHRHHMSAEKTASNPVVFVVDSLVLREVAWGEYIVRNLDGRLWQRNKSLSTLATGLFSYPDLTCPRGIRRVSNPWQLDCYSGNTLVSSALFDEVE